MTDTPASSENGAADQLTYEQKMAKLDEILTRLDNSETPIDGLTEDVKTGAKLIKELNAKLKQVEACLTLKRSVKSPSENWMKASKILTMS